MYEQKGEHDTQYTKHIRLKKEFEWLLSEEFERLREGFVPVDNREFMHDPRRKGSDKDDKKANKEKITPYTRDISNDQYNEFIAITNEMVMDQAEDNSIMDIDKHTIGGETLRARLVASGKFNMDEATETIQIMLERGILEIASYDTYRRKRN